MLVAARAAGVYAIDGPHMMLDAPDGLAAEAAATRALGYDGKWAIHPRQVPVITAAFSSSAQGIAAANATLTALEAARADGAGAVAHSGAMVDEASRRAALNVLARTAS